MANTAVLVYQSHNRLRYLITADEVGGAFEVQNDGGATPDLQTDSLAGPIKQIALAQTQGIGDIAPGALTQAQARALLLADGSEDVGNSRVPRCICVVTDRTAAAALSVDANQSAGNPIITGTIAADGVGYLDVIALQSPPNA